MKSQLIRTSISGPDRKKVKSGSDGASSAEIPTGEIGPAVVRPASNSIGFESEENDDRLRAREKETKRLWRERNQRMNERGREEGRKERTEGRTDGWPGNPDRISRGDATEARQYYRVDGRAPFRRLHRSIHQDLYSV